MRLISLDKIEIHLTNIFSIDCTEPHLRKSLHNPQMRGQQCPFGEFLLPMERRNVNLETVQVWSYRTVFCFLRPFFETVIHAGSVFSPGHRVLALVSRNSGYVYRYWSTWSSALRRAYSPSWAAGQTVQIRTFRSDQIGTEKLIDGHSFSLAFKNVRMALFDRFILRLIATGPMPFPW
jgi:hypothetical protein